jgi:hypothetical protein
MNNNLKYNSTCYLFDIIDDKTYPIYIDKYNNSFTKMNYDSDYYIPLTNLIPNRFEIKTIK